MELRLVFKALGFFLLVGIGIPGNIIILLKFTHLKITEKKLLPANLILTMLALVNILVVLSRGIPQSLTAIGITDIFHDYECKCFIYVYRVCRAMSICVTSLLSCYQCIVIAPATSVWLFLKRKVTPNVTVVIFFLWGINLSIYPSCILYSYAMNNSSMSEYTLNLEFCYVAFSTYTIFVANGSVFACRDFLFVGLMMLASCYIVVILHRHRKQVQGIRSSDRNPGRTAEYQAARSVVLLVTFYVLLFGLDSAIWLYTLLLSRVGPMVTDARVFFGSLYTAVSPIIIILTNKSLQAPRQYTRKKILLHSPETTCSQVQ
ncbi:olfactory receptor class A-like protein 1 [Rhinatrema bivittatum]|uniref:olfactory receptor class A-like protein 1 n=1 Tax=Rhinatrema bivittatum TaxID=194408 RepID=UPI00112E3588|nr:olfactory receptor class A-like protein 1 [Rhinatrema bivittatum]